MEHSDDIYPARYREISSRISAKKFRRTIDRYSGTQPSTKGTTIAPPGLSVAASHRQVSPSQLGLASEPKDAFKRRRSPVNLHTRAARKPVIVRSARPP